MTAHQDTPTSFSDLASQALDDSERTVAIAVPVGESVESVLGEYHEHAFFRVGAAVPVGVNLDGEAVVMVTLRRSGVSSVVVAGFKGLIYFAETFPHAEQSSLTRREERRLKPNSDSYYESAVQGLTRRALEAADAVDALAAMYTERGTSISGLTEGTAAMRQRIADLRK